MGPKIGLFPGNSWGYFSIRFLMFFDGRFFVFVAILAFLDRFRRPSLFISDHFGLQSGLNSMTNRSNSCLFVLEKFWGNLGAQNRFKKATKNGTSFGNRLR